tara:strand:+ start:220 stop:849 length:630 start_codon:yes stop_codon:yes gene_type:complete
MFIQINPIKVVNGLEYIIMSMNCIPKSYLNNNSIQDLKQLCNQNKQPNIMNRSSICQSFIKERNMIIFNYVNERNSIISIELLNWLIENIKSNFQILEKVVNGKKLKFFQDHLLIFNLNEAGSNTGYYQHVVRTNDLKEILHNCIEIIYEEFIYKLEKRLANMLVRNYVEFRYNPKYDYCKYFLNKQYDEYLLGPDMTLGPKRKKVKIN